MKETVAFAYSELAKKKGFRTFITNDVDGNEFEYSEYARIPLNKLRENCKWPDAVFFERTVELSRNGLL